MMKMRKTRLLLMIGMLCLLLFTSTIGVAAKDYPTKLIEGSGIIDSIDLPLGGWRKHRLIMPDLGEGCS